MSALLFAALAACGSGKDSQNPDAASDGPAPDAVPSCVPRVLLTGGTDVVAQGWTPITQQPFTLTYGADYTRLETTTPTGARSGGQLLLAYPDAIEPGKPFAFQIELMIESVAAHNQYDAAAAIMGSLTTMVGNQTDRDQMVYLEAGRLGWADDTAMFAKNLLDGAYHTYVLSRDEGGIARLTVDGTLALMRNAFTSNGRIAVGDQTNEAAVDAVLRVRKITKLCP